MHAPPPSFAVIAGLLACQAFSAPEKPVARGSPPGSKTRCWPGPGNNHQVVRARFIRKEQADSSCLNWKTALKDPSLINWFSPQSLKQASEEAEKQADQTIAHVRE